MKKLGYGIAIALGLAVGLSGTAFAQQKASHLHMDHVLKSWKDTPDQKGLLGTSQAEAAIALQHIGFALSKPGDLGNIKLHAAHVINALDPSVIAKGALIKLPENEYRPIKLFNDSVCIGDEIWIRW